MRIEPAKYCRKTAEKTTGRCVIGQILYEAGVPDEKLNAIDKGEVTGNNYAFNYMCEELLKDSEFYPYSRPIKWLIADLSRIQNAFDSGCITSRQAMSRVRNLIKKDPDGWNKLSLKIKSALGVSS